MTQKTSRVRVKEYPYYVKHWFGNMNMTSNCDVPNNAHQIQMTTICHWMKPPVQIFCDTPLLKCEACLFHCVAKC